MIGLGFLGVIHTYPSILQYLAIMGSLYIMYMGYKIASSKPEIEVKKSSVPQFYEGFLLQWLNPKAWIACVSGASLFSSTESSGMFLIFASIYFVVCYLSLAAWAILGDRLSLLLGTQTRLRIFNMATGAMLVGTAGYLCYSNYL
jgi:threonine/homoserine/homoserine lactone efflux protein